MLSQTGIANIKAEIEKPRESLDDCTDTGVRSFIKAMIEQQKEKLESERDSKSQLTDKSEG